MSDKVKEKKQEEKDQSLRVQILVYRCMGIDLWSPTMANDRPWLTFVTMGPLFLFMVPMFLAAHEYITQVSLLSDTLGSTFASMLTLVKFLLFCYHRKEFVGLIYHIRAILAKGKFLLIKKKNLYNIKIYFIICRNRSVA